MIENRIFIVGCVRSGTTLLQAMLHAHPQIHSLPETKFFDCLIGIDRRAFLRERPRGLKAKIRAVARDSMVKVGVIDPGRQFHAWRRLREFTENSGSVIRAESGSFLISRQAEAFVKFMDLLTLRERKSMWVEKTPDHLFYIPHIERHVPSARFVHMIRSGTDNVASLYANAHKYPGPYWSHYQTPEAAVLRWNVAIEESQKYRANPAHYFIRYEDLARKPANCLEGVCAFLGCRFDGRMVTNYADTASNLIEPFEEWKSGNRHRVAGPARSKYAELFDAAQRAYIEKSLLPLPWPVNWC